MNIVAHSQSQEYYPVDVCRGDFPSLGLAVAFSGEERNWQNCWVYYQLMVTIVLIFFITFHYYIFLVFWSFISYGLFYQKIDFRHLRQWASVMPKQEKTRNAMRRSSCILCSFTLILTIPIFWEAYLEAIRTSMMELFGKRVVSWLLFPQSLS